MAGVTTQRSPAAVIALCATALVGFAANSLLCRTALGDHSIDAASFTAVRIGAGALVLVVLARGRAAIGAGTWTSAVMLFGYAAAFSFAYLRLTTATGALILFAIVQATMIGWGVIRGARPGVLEWLGLAIATAGLVALTLPGLAAPDPIGAILMVGAGVCWGVYSLRGRDARRPLAATADHFVRAVPMAIVLLVAIPITGTGAISAEGAILAAASGAIASGLGYTLWYAALPFIPPARAAGGGAIVLDEPVTLRLGAATLAILGGIALALLAKRRARPNASML
jgi:drug/metabolite transporter (DMT)-like permease